jgi:hypothetical protein
MSETRKSFNNPRAEPRTYMNNIAKQTQLAITSQEKPETAGTATFGKMPEYKDIQVTNSGFTKNLRRNIHFRAKGDDALAKVDAITTTMATYRGLQDRTASEFRKFRL